MRALGVAVGLVLLAQVARAAQDPVVEQARAHVKAAIALYDDGRYADSAREMEEAYRLKPLPDLQYNLAQCYERLGRLPDAVEAYKKYLAGKPEADDHEAVAARVANLEQRIAEAKAGQAVAPPPPVEKVVLKTVVVYREAPPPPGRGVRYAALGLGVLGLGALASGIAFAVLAKQNGDAVTNGGNALAPVSFDGRFADAQQAGHTEQVAAWVSFGVAAACAGGAVGLFLLGRHIDKEAAAAQKVSLVPIASPTSAGLLVAGRF